MLLVLLLLIPETYLLCLVKIGSVIDEMLLLLLLLFVVIVVVVVDVYVDVVVVVDPRNLPLKFG